MNQTHPPKANVSVLMPVYNEEETIAIVLNKVMLLPFVKEAIVVNDCSKDNSLSKIQELVQKFGSDKIVVHSFSQNSGKTAAIQKAIELASGEIMIIQDADLEYDPEEIIEVIAPIQNGIADVVYGSRFLVRKASRVLYFYHYLANKLLTVLSNLLTNLNMTDIETCYKAFRAPILKPLKLTSKGFGLEVEFTAIVSKLPLRFYEVPISYYGRTYEEGKKISFWDGIDALWYIFYFNLWDCRKAFRKTYYQDVKKALHIK